MPFTSFLVRSSTALVPILSLLTGSAVALPQDLVARQAAANSISYTLDKEYSGPTFFDDFWFFGSADPTHGYVTYGDRSYAEKNSLIDFDGEYAIMRVDNHSVLSQTGGYSGVNGIGRKSVRIEGNYEFTHGLIVADFGKMPSGICGTWPAFWTLGKAAWPADGEIDIIEGANIQGGNWMTLHTGSPSTIDGDNDAFSGSIASTDCDVRLGTSSVNYAGCKISDPDTSSYDKYTGGVWAMQWTSDRIKVWYWPYNSVPADVLSSSPQPGSSTWGLPRSSFSPSSNLRVDENFRNHHLVFDTTFCGDMGDISWASSGCAASTKYDTCAAFVAANPSAFDDAVWKVKYVKIFKEGTAASPAANPTTPAPAPTPTTPAPVVVATPPVEVPSPVTPPTVVTPPPVVTTPTVVAPTSSSPVAASSSPVLVPARLPVPQIPPVAPSSTTSSAATTTSSSTSSSSSAASSSILSFSSQTSVSTTSSTASVTPSISVSSNTSTSSIASITTAPSTTSSRPSTSSTTTSSRRPIRCPGSPN